MRPPLDVYDGEKNATDETIRVALGIKLILAKDMIEKILPTLVKLGSDQRRRDCDKLDALTCRNWYFNLKIDMTRSEDNAHCHILTNESKTAQ
jgi:hypothetical protein